MDVHVSCSAVQSKGILCKGLYCLLCTGIVFNMGVLLILNWVHFGAFRCSGYIF
jgi:hypothetical protein